MTRASHAQNYNRSNEKEQYTLNIMLATAYNECTKAPEQNSGQTNYYHK